MSAVNDFDTEEPAIIEVSQPQSKIETLPNGKPLQCTTLHNGSIMLFHGDCFDILPHLKAGTVDMIFADLPYGTTAFNWDKLLNLSVLWPMLHSITKTNSALLFTAVQPFTSLLICSNLKYYKYNWIWYKNNATGFQRAKKEPMRSYEDVCTFYRAAPTYNPIMQPSRIKDRKVVDGASNGNAFVYKRQNVHGISVSTKHPSRTLVYPHNVLRIDVVPRATGTLHPTQKPLELLEYLIKTYTKPGDLVLDPTMGSGTTAVACGKLRRRCIGIEMDQTYFNIAVQRVKELN
jgi:site-specific DNA-methyltransferase (adenine-specific)